MCCCPGDCEGAPECLDDEGGPLPAVALEPDTLPPHGLTAELAQPLIAKEIGLPACPAKWKQRKAQGLCASGSRPSCC
jgi:hypothetical protein